jgi:hypothetical protein
MIRRLRLPAVVTVSAFSLLLSACSSSSYPVARSSSTTTKSTPGEIPTTSVRGSPKSVGGFVRTGVAGIIPTSVPDDVSIRHDVDLINCTPTQGGWSAGGTVKNSSRRRTTYLITVFFTSKQATDLAYSMSTVRLEAGQAKLWSTSATFPAPAQVLCVLRGVAKP